MLLNFAAILITFSVNVTFCVDYYILWRNSATEPFLLIPKRSSKTLREDTLRSSLKLWCRHTHGLFMCSPCFQWSTIMLVFGGVVALRFFYGILTCKIIVSGAKLFFSLVKVIDLGLWLQESFWKTLVWGICNKLLAYISYYTVTIDTSYYTVTIGEMANDQFLQLKSKTKFFTYRLD